MRFAGVLMGGFAAGIAVWAHKMNASKSEQEESLLVEGKALSCTELLSSKLGRAFIAFQELEKKS